MIDMIVESETWDEDALMSLANNAIGATLTHLDLDAQSFEIALLACDDARIAELNGDFRAKPTPTNVLSWPSEERSPDVREHPEAPDDIELEDIAIAFETCTREANSKQAIWEYVSHLLVHGTHLLGYDHINDADAVLMEQLEREILGKWEFQTHMYDFRAQAADNRKDKWAKA